jgi:hypothetical protein
MAGMTKDTTKAGTMLWLAGLAALATAALSLGPGCKKAAPVAAADAGEGGPTAPVAQVEAAAPLAANEADVTRYPDEKATPGSTLTTETPAELRTEVGAGGKLVFVVPKGTEVDKLAERASHYLLVVADPQARRLMGWSSEGAFGGAGGFHPGGAAVHPGDAGKVVADAGSVPAGSSGFSCVKQKAGKCTAPYVVSQAVCRLPCKLGADCKGPEPKCNAGLCFASNGCE